MSRVKELIAQRSHTIVGGGRCTAYLCKRYSGALTIHSITRFPGGNFLTSGTPRVVPAGRALAILNSRAKSGA